MSFVPNNKTKKNTYHNNNISNEHQIYNLANPTCFWKRTQFAGNKILEDILLRYELKNNPL
jgi:hypothetical protein